jgi:ADP-ribose pyrophosphatase YjhB (NUDIX family)
MRQFVGVILTTPKGSVLAQHRDNKPNILGPDKWAVLGGAKERWDLLLRRTGARELREETRYQASIFGLHFLTRDIYTTERGRLVRRTIYVGQYDNRQKIECHEGQEIRFITLEERRQLSEEDKIYTGHSGFFELASEWGRRK